MRLLEIKADGALCFTDKLYDDLPPYAILSHTWGRDADEVYYKDMLKDRAKTKPGYRKIEICAKLAIRHGLRHFWIDTCCIKQGDSSEVSEAVNSMFKWYQESAVCYVYLADVAIPADGNGDREIPPDLHLIHQNYDAYNALRNSTPNWFKRGWTLQELIAPKVVKFYSQEGTYIGDKDNLSSWIRKCTNLPFGGLASEHVHRFSIKDRLTWAATRRTKRPEDRAYCLLGIFGIHMNLLYGEGQKNAFDRLERKVAKRERERMLHATKLLSSLQPVKPPQLSMRQTPAGQRSDYNLYFAQQSIPRQVQNHADAGFQSSQQAQPTYLQGNAMFSKSHGEPRDSSWRYLPRPAAATFPTHPIIDPPVDNLRHTEGTTIAQNRPLLATSDIVPYPGQNQSDLLQSFDFNATDYSSHNQASSSSVDPAMRLNEMRTTNTSGLTPPNPQSRHKARAKSDMPSARSGNRGRAPGIIEQLESSAEDDPIASRPPQMGPGNSTMSSPRSELRARSPSLSVDTTTDPPKRKRGRPTKEEQERRFKEYQAARDSTENAQIVLDEPRSFLWSTEEGEKAPADRKNLSVDPRTMAGLPELGDGMMLQFLNRLADPMYT